MGRSLRKNEGGRKGMLEELEEAMWFYNKTREEESATRYYETGMKAPEQPAK